MRRTDRGQKTEFTVAGMLCEIILKLTEWDRLKKCKGELEKELTKILTKDKENGTNKYNENNINKLKQQMVRDQENVTMQDFLSSREL